MAETLTANYGWTKPDPGASANTWGSTLNATTDKVDAQVKANEVLITAGQAPLGAIIMWPGIGLPAGWTWCLGSTLSRTSYAALFAIVGTRFGAGDGSTTFNLPNLGGKTPVGYDGGGWAMGATGGEVTHTMSAAEMPTHIHGVSDPGHTHNVYDPTHTHTISQSGHIHPDGGHTHGLSQAYQDAHAHNLTRNPASNVAGGNVAAGSGWAFTDVDTDAQQPALHIVIAAAGVNQGAQNANVANANAATGIGIYGNYTGISIQSAGSGSAHNNMQPYQVLAFIIRIV